jgi:hypothetical protein
MTFYDNGIVSVYLSTNPSRGVCETIWPYSVYQWDEASKRYNDVGMLYGFDKELAVKAGQTYPDGADPEGYGTVYYLVDGSADSKLMDRRAYESWYEKIFGGAAAKEVTYLAMTDENISGILGR